MSQTLVKLSNRLTPNQKKFVAEVIGTFIVVVFATGSVVIDSKMHGDANHLLLDSNCAIALSEIVVLFGIRIIK